MEWLGHTKTDFAFTFVAIRSSRTYFVTAYHTKLLFYTSLWFKNFFLSKERIDLSKERIVKFNYHNCEIEVLGKT